MTQVFRTSRRVEFRDTDTAGIVHFSVFFVYMEQAEHELLRSAGLGVMSEIEGRHVSFPRVQAECNYRSPIRFEEMVDVEVVVRRLGSKSVTYGFRFVCDGRDVADGSVTAVCCDMSGDKPVSIEISESIRNGLLPYQEPYESTD